MMKRMYDKASGAVDQMERNPIVRLIGFVVVLVTLFATWIQLKDISDGQEARHWQILTTKAPGNSGKRKAVEWLFERGHVLDGVDLSCHNMTGLEPENCRPWTYLAGLDLNGKQNGGVSIADVDLRGVNLRNCKLQGITFRRFKMNNSSTEGCMLDDIEFYVGGDQRFSLSGGTITNVEIFQSGSSVVNIENVDAHNVEVRSSANSDDYGASGRRPQTVRIYGSNFVNSYIWFGGGVGLFLENNNLSGTEIVVSRAELEALPGAIAWFRENYFEEGRPPLVEDRDLAENLLETMFVCPPGAAVEYRYLEMEKIEGDVEYGKLESGIEKYNELSASRIHAGDNVLEGSDWRVARVPAVRASADVCERAINKGITTADLQRSAPPPLPLLSFDAQLRPPPAPPEVSAPVGR